MQAAALADPVVGSRFTAVAPLRVLDTRDGVGRSGTLGAQQSFVLSLGSSVPADVTAVVLNLTGTAPTASTFVTVWPDGAPWPTASNLNLAAGQTTPNLVTVALGTGKKPALYNNSGAVHLIAGLAGYYATCSGAGFGAAPPSRVLDTRTGVSGCARAR